MAPVGQAEMQRVQLPQRTRAGSSGGRTSSRVRTIREPATARFTADSVVNRKDFGLRWNAAIETGGVVVGDMVHIVISAVAELVA